MDQPSLPVTEAGAVGAEAPASAPEGPLHELVSRERARWLAQAKALASDARALTPLTKAKAFEDLTKLPQLVHKARAKVAADGQGQALLDELVASVQRHAEVQRRELAKQLSEACQRHGLELTVVRREEPIEVRIPPFSVEIDRAKGRAKLQFARLALDSCAASADAIVKLVLSQRDSWSRGFEPARFFEACHSAWAAARATGLGGPSERVEILDFLPFLALRLQPQKFLQEPSAKHFVDYTRAHFAFDLMQLRRAALLVHDGWRINLGVATGTTATNKKRAVFVEDERGQGEFKLTVYFTRAQ